MVRVVLYCEGSRESGRMGALPIAPTEILPEGSLGPAHVLCRRAIVARTRIPEAAIQFQAPLRIRTVVARGSDLLVRARLRRLLTWPDTTRMPRVAVVLVDRDGCRDRANELRDFVSDLVVPPHVIAVAIEEFEAWLIADAALIARLTTQQLDQVPRPETLLCGEAKARLDRWLPARDRSKLRVEVAKQCRLNLVAQSCPAFEAFMNDLQLALED